MTFKTISRPHSFLIIALTMILITGWHSRLEPLERDFTTYAVIGQEMLRGRLLYTDLWDHKPPAIHVTYMIATALWGRQQTEIMLLYLITAVITALGIYRISQRTAGDAAAGYAVLIWAFCAGDVALQCNQPNTEVFINAALIWAFYWFLRCDEGNWKAAVWTGLLFLLGSLYKQIAIVPAALLAIGYLGQAWRQGGFRQVKPRLGQVALIGGIGASGWGAVFLYFYLQGRLADFYAAVFQYNAIYCGNLWTNLGAIIDLLNPQNRVYSLTLNLLVLLALIGILWQKHSSRSFQVSYLLYLAGMTIAVSLPGKNFPHYSQLLLPAAALGTGIFLSCLEQWGRNTGRPVWRLLVFLLLATLSVRQASFWSKSPETLSLMRYGPEFVITQNMGNIIKQLLRPEERFYEWGCATGLYYYSGFPPPTGLFYCTPLFFPPFDQELGDRLLRDLTAQPPDLLMLNEAYYLPHLGREKTAWPTAMQVNYTPIKIEPFSAYGYWFGIKKGSPLESRLKSAMATGNAHE